MRKLLRLRRPPNFSNDEMKNVSRVRGYNIVQAFDPLQKFHTLEDSDEFAELQSFIAPGKFSD